MKQLTQRKEYTSQQPETSVTPEISGTQYTGMPKGGYGVNETEEKN